MTTGHPKLTVIIPTLNRPETLAHTLATVVNQDYTNYSILVSDNYSEADVKTVVEKFNDNRITYVRTPERLSMSHHWEFVLKRVEEGFVTILGDDDGLLPGSLSRVAAMLTKHKDIEAIGWRFANFNWKGLPPHFMIPMGNYYRLVDAKKEIERIFQLSAYSTIQFPSLYGGFISIDLIKRLREKFNGQFFHSRIPDFFSGALVAASVSKYIRCEFPLSINATSKYSTGFATISSKNDQTAFNSLRSNTSNNIPFHSKLIFIRSNAVPITEAMLQVHDLVPSFPSADLHKLIKEVINEASTVDAKEMYDELTVGIREIARINNISEFCEQQIAAGNYNPQTYKVKQKFSPVSNTIYFNTTNSSVNTVQDACAVVSNIIPAKQCMANAALGEYYSKFVSVVRYCRFKLFSEYKSFI
ncbi:MAG: glycosyltransferase family A protein [Ferruginibacter sp.]